MFSEEGMGWQVNTEGRWRVFSALMGHCNYRIFNYE